MTDMARNVAVRLCWREKLTVASSTSTAPSLIAFPIIAISLGLLVRVLRLSPPDL